MIIEMLLRSKSLPFNGETVVELKFESTVGEMYLRVPVAESKDWLLGDVYAVRLVRV